MKGLAAIRAELDDVDRELVALLARRAQLVAAAWRLKDAQGLQHGDPAREAAIFAAALDQAQAAGLDRVAMQAVLEKVVGVDLLGKELSQNESF
ncbi:MAG: hypothetical protein EXR77_18560 [Myxococcales bacterium]|nr:hypothetical protein [Myxococcales bacterium]